MTSQQELVKQLEEAEKELKLQKEKQESIVKKREQMDSSTRLVIQNSVKEYLNSIFPNYDFVVKYHSGRYTAVKICLVTEYYSMSREKWVKKESEISLHLVDSFSDSLEELKNIWEINWFSSRTQSNDDQYGYLKYLQVLGHIASQVENPYDSSILIDLFNTIKSHLIEEKAIVDNIRQVNDWQRIVNDLKQSIKQAEFDKDIQKGAVFVLKEEVNRSRCDKIYIDKVTPKTCAVRFVKILTDGREISIEEKTQMRKTDLQKIMFRGGDNMVFDRIA